MPHKYIEEKVAELTKELSYGGRCNHLDDTMTMGEVEELLRTALTEAEARGYERGREEIFTALKENIPDGANVKVRGMHMNEAGVGGWNQLRYCLLQNFEHFSHLKTITKEDKE